jgi:hypothetical protein
LVQETGKAFQQISNISIAKQNQLKTEEAIIKALSMNDAALAKIVSTQTTVEQKNKLF